MNKLAEYKAGIEKRAKMLYGLDIHDLMHQQMAHQHKQEIAATVAATGLGLGLLAYRGHKRKQKRLQNKVAHYKAGIEKLAQMEKTAGVGWDIHGYSEHPDIINAKLKQKEQIDDELWNKAEMASPLGFSNDQVNKKPRNYIPAATTIGALLGAGLTARMIHSTPHLTDAAEKVFATLGGGLLGGIGGHAIGRSMNPAAIVQSSPIRDEQWERTKAAYNEAAAALSPEDKALLDVDLHDARVDAPDSNYKFNEWLHGNYGELNENHLYDYMTDEAYSDIPTSVTLDRSHLKDIRQKYVNMTQKMIDDGESEDYKAAAQGFIDRLDHLHNNPKAKYFRLEWE